MTIQRGHAWNMGKPTPDGQERRLETPLPHTPGRIFPGVPRSQPELRPEAQLEASTRKRIRDGRPQAALAQVDPRRAHRRDRLHRRGERPGCRAQSARGVPPGAASLGGGRDESHAERSTPPRTPPPPAAALCRDPPWSSLHPGPFGRRRRRRRAHACRPPPGGRHDDRSRRTRLAKGTVLELTVPARTCAPEDGQRRFTARLASPVRASGATVLPAGTTAVLHLRRGGNPVAPRARLDSLVRPDLAVAVPTSQVQIPRGSVNGVCLRADARDKRGPGREPEYPTPLTLGSFGPPGVSQCSALVSRSGPCEPVHAVLS